MTWFVKSSLIAIFILMVETIQRHGLSDRLGRWKWNLNWVKKGAMVSAALILLITFFLIYIP